VTRLNSTGAQQMKPDHDELTRRLIEFRDERDWRQFHSLKNLIMSAAMEAAEIMELTQWKDDEAVESAAQGDTQFRAALAEECADVYLYLLLICERAEIDLTEAAMSKIELNARKYPVDKAKGNAKKYTDL
jgi:NTP pyrophosphatase (non-canonical NTP hydrolase)